jgi:hypothetical protein
MRDPRMCACSTFSIVAAGTTHACRARRWEHHQAACVLRLIMSGPGLVQEDIMAIQQSSENFATRETARLIASDKVEPPYRPAWIWHRWFCGSARF